MSAEQQSNVLVFASGTPTGGGSGFRELVESTRTKKPILNARIVGVVSNHEYGGVRKHADELSIPFTYWNGPFDANGYQRRVKECGADHVMLSGYLQKVMGLDPQKTVNVHPALLPMFGGKGMYGHHVHEAVIRDYKEGRITQSGFSMHFVTKETEEYDSGPVAFQFPVAIRKDDTALTIAARVNEKERAWQAIVLNEIVHERIRLADDLRTVIYDHPRISIPTIETMGA